MWKWSPISFTNSVLQYKCTKSYLLLQKATFNWRCTAVKALCFICSPAHKTKGMSMSTRGWGQGGWGQIPLHPSSTWPSLWSDREKATAPVSGEQGRHSHHNTGRTTAGMNLETHPLVWGPHWGERSTYRGHHKCPREQSWRSKIMAALFSELQRSLTGKYGLQPKGKS